MSRTRYLFLGILFILALALTLPALAAPQYVASYIRDPFHIVSCKWARKIADSNAVYYETREEAMEDGHRPCKVCNP